MSNRFRSKLHDKDKWLYRFGAQVSSHFTHPSEFPKKSNHFWRFTLYNFLFLSLQFALASLQDNSFLQTLSLPWVVYFELIATFFLHLLLYLGLAVLQTLWLWGIRPARWTTERWLIIIWSTTACFLLTANCYFFPLSQFSKYLQFIPPFMMLIGMCGSALFLTLLTLNTCVFILKRVFHSARALGKKSIVVAVAITLSLFGTLITSMDKSQNVLTSSSKPNIIIVGIDSLAPEVIQPKLTPALARFVQHGVLYQEAISPLAQTYPAWASLLTGLYPKNHHALYDLMPSNLVKSHLSVAWNLQKQGYKTIFATDDRRFNNLGSDFGFQTVIGPKVGINDFLIGTLNDYPLSNLLINLPISRWLFPYNYINRASYFSYYPQSFNHALVAALKEVDRNSPLFLCVHFTLPHWPYAFAASKPSRVKDVYQVFDRQQLYLDAVRASDLQFAKLFHTLKTLGILQNSLLIVLSDHGEAFYHPGSRHTQAKNYQGHSPSHLEDYLQRNTSTSLDMSVGHGSDLLSPSQYRCLLVFKIYAHHQRITQPQRIKNRVALIDIAPTIYTFLKLKSLYPMDGISLLASLQQQEKLPDRAFFMESGMLPNQFLTRQKAIAWGQLLFTVNPKNLHLEVKTSALPLLDQMKLYAILQGDWLVALYPDRNGYLPITQHLTDDQWTDDMATPFAQNSPAPLMFQSIKTFYQNTLPIDGEY